VSLFERRKNRKKRRQLRTKNKISRKQKPVNLCYTHFPSARLLITAVYQVPTDNILIRSLIQWDTVSPSIPSHRPRWIRAILLSFFIFIFLFRSHIELGITIASVIKMYIRTTRFLYIYFFPRHRARGRFFIRTHVRTIHVMERERGEKNNNKKTLSVVVSNCANPFKKDVFQFPGLPPPPIGPLPALQYPLRAVNQPLPRRVPALNILFSNNKYPENIYIYIYTHTQTRARMNVYNVHTHTPRGKR